VLWRLTGVFVGLAATTAAAVTLGAGGGDGSGNRGLIVYWRDSPWPSIWAMQPDGSGRHRILRNHQNAKRPVLSAGRAWVAFDGAPPGKRAMSDFDIQIVRLDGSGRRTLTRSSAWDVDAQWSPDGKLLSFSRQPPHPQDASGASVWIVQRDGSGLRRVVSGFGARWSPDGTRLVYETRDGDLHVIGADGSGDRALLTGPALDWPAAWSRDGRKILFTRSPRTDVFDVFVVNADGTGVKRLAHGVAGSWSPDGPGSSIARSTRGPSTS
jgi:Tol biopolymer transport system component